MREEGYYWVKPHNIDKWVIALWIPFENVNSDDDILGKWAVPYCVSHLYDSNLGAIHETRILPPQN